MNEAPTRVVPPRGRWRTIPRDVFVLVASILIAFGLDAWWDWRTARRDEREKLQGLQQEFKQIQSAIRTQIGGHTRIRAASDTLLTLMGPRPLPEGGERIQVLLGKSMIPTTLDIGNGTLVALITAGKLELIRSAELRGALAGWSAVLRDATEDEELARDYVIQSFLPLVADETGINALVTFGGPGVALSQFPPRYDRLLANPRVAAVLMFRSAWARHVVDEMNGVEHEAERILRLIQSELQRH